MFYEKAVLKNFEIFIEKHLFWSLLMKLQAYRKVEVLIINDRKSLWTIRVIFSTQSDI